jgi:hypothetical protein
MRTMLRSAGTGVLLGASWGVLARVWMRMISTSPEFSWSGTLLIIGIAGLGGLALGLVHGARVTGRRRWWRLAVVLALPISSMAQGIVFAPAFWLGGWALAGRGPRWLRWAGIAVGAAPAVLLWATSPTRDRELIPAPTFIAGFLLLAAGMACGGLQVFSRWPRRQVQEPSTRRPAGVGQTTIAD